MWLLFDVQNAKQLYDYRNFDVRAKFNKQWYFSFWKSEFLIDENIEFNEKNFNLRSKFDELENHFIFKFYNKFNIVRINAIVDALKCAQLILQFDNFMSLCAHEMTVNENAMKFDVFVSKKLTFWFDKKIK